MQIFYCNFAAITTIKHNKMEQEKNAEIIDRIKYLMREMGVKQVQFAERIGVDTSNLSKYLRQDTRACRWRSGGKRCWRRYARL